MRSWKVQMLRMGRAAIRRVISPATLLVSLLATALLAIGCEAHTRYRVLSFFFDGVPVPAGMEVPGASDEKIIGPWGIELDPDDPRAERIRQARARSQAMAAAQELENLYTHKPVRRRQCTDLQSGCHSAVSFQAKTSGDACRKCHEKHYDLPADEWIHGPTAQGDCRVCHLPHLGPNPGLLVAPQSELCLGCHDDARLPTRTYHADLEEKRCTDCHDPHSAGNRLLLVDSGSLARRVHVQSLPSKHDTEWDKNTCEQCHLAATSKQVVKDVDRICMSCHEDVQEEARAKEYHQPVQEGKCTSCHKAHKSSRPNLIEPAAEKICLSCHELNELDKDKHPNVRRADCLLCHTGHTSSRRYLLRDTAYAPGVPVRTQPASTEQTPPDLSEDDLQ